MWRHYCKIVTFSKKPCNQLWLKTMVPKREQCWFYIFTWQKLGTAPNNIFQNLQVVHGAKCLSYRTVQGCIECFRGGKSEQSVCEERAEKLAVGSEKLQIRGDRCHLEKSNEWAFVHETLYVVYHPQPAVYRVQLLNTSPRKAVAQWKSSRSDTKSMHCI